MFDIFKIVFTDPKFLSAFSQTIIIIAIGFFFIRKGIVTSSAKSVLNTFNFPNDFCDKDDISSKIL